MRAKSRASQIAKAMIFVAVLVSSTAVAPSTYHDVGVPTSSNNIAVGSSTTPNTSVKTYHDV